MADSEDDGVAEDGLPPLRQVIARTGLSAKKSLGQNFLLDLNLTRRIARSAGPLKEVIEIGPGPGGLTRALLMEGAEHVIAIERDERCLEALHEISARWPGRLTLVEGDALQIDATAHLRGGDAQIVANLPYNIGTELIIRWLRAGVDHMGTAGKPWWSRITVMLQKEVAQRIAAATGSNAYGRLAVLTRWRGEARILFDVSPRAFTPPPKVTSSIVQITPSAAPRLDCALPALERVTLAAFNQRRKMLRRSLQALGPANPGGAFDAEELLNACEIDPTRRAETLTPEDFARIARMWKGA
ncbi:MAG: 16S rRNA (adenine(1518)-N(6)/adenine(1519)-N(6))-dimethyltransferase RsmA [Neomegalonema sp.]|nr:16S rRNA (adenine(1518)-N(6)/adenine(1519)-N(6))-dimethyltransferase RsmA [Neomegalonema sp.]